jgi:hypothetical protein
MLIVAQSFIIALGLRVGFDRWDAIVLTAINVLLVMFVGVKLPTGFLASVVLTAWIVWRAWPALSGSLLGRPRSMVRDARSPG